MLFSEEKLYRIEFIEPCLIYASHSLLRFRNSSILDVNNLSSKQHGVIPEGIKDWVIKKWGKLYFSPDVNQEGLEFFLPSEQPHILISLKKIGDHLYKNIEC
ncbi:hypothetical protein [Priestia endophytica]|uniref:hypothetical protein n=1 Tax=Priestia endophytica TaxID=135735 RepID=UPI00227DBA71|nr:hypothetical protein [Priestia endophytica]MCY8235060.1 hypothetical protein [Priestia endophytica]